MFLSCLTGLSGGLAAAVSTAPRGATAGRGRDARRAPGWPRGLDRLRILETWLALSLKRVGEEIAAVERPVEPWRAPRPPAPAAARVVVPRREPTPDWGISSAGIGRSVAEVRRGDCFAGGVMQPLSAERARAELADGVQVCGVCRPGRQPVVTAGSIQPRRLGSGWRGRGSLGECRRRGLDPPAGVSGGGGR
ncbi:DUF6233 domain-containing protein [Streptomyces griseus]|uniref:DUF6233 domain-containing protein n=1 Tax=Streptomyces griseus TaxID=1911 RepID=UPI0037B76112